MRGVVICLADSDPVLIASPVEGNIAEVMLRISQTLATPKAMRIGPLILGTVSSLCTAPSGDVSAGEIPSTIIDTEKVVSAQMVEIVWTEGELGWVPIALAADYAKNQDLD